MIHRHMGKFVSGVCVGAIAIATAAPATAQTTAAQSTTAPQASSAAAPATTGIADIVVTATRRSESLQKVPISITALSGNELTQANVVNLQDVGTLSPGVQIQPQFKPGDAIFQIRGQVQADSAPSIDASVGVYFDDVYIGRSSGSLTNLVDVSRVEVLKGPQGTLFGKNTTGGAIRIVSNAPTQILGGYASGEYESFDHYRLTGVVNVPAGDTLAFRFAGQYDKKNGGYETNTVNNTKVDKLETYSFRGSMLWTPTTRMRLLVEGDYSKITGGGLPAHLRYYNPVNGPYTALEVALESGQYDFAPTGAAFGANIATGTAILNALSTPNGTRTVGNSIQDATASSFTFNPGTGKFTYVGGEVGPSTFTRTWGALANFTYDLDFATLKSITAYREVKSSYLYDTDGTMFNIINSNQHQTQNQFSEELLLNGKAANNQLDWTLGGIYFNEKPYEQDVDDPLAGLSYFGGSAGTDTRSTSTNKSYGVFAQGTYKFSDQFSFTAGTRYSTDEKGFIASSYGRTPTGTQSCLYTTAGGFPTSIAGLDQAACSITQKRTFHQWSYTASFNFQFDKDKLFYVKTSRGYRAGGFNPRINAPEVISAFAPEVVTDYEAGLKADWLEHTLRTDLSVFHSIGSNVQSTVNGVAASNGAVITLTENVGKRIVDGFELSLIEQPAKWLSFDQSVTYLHAVTENPLTPDDRSVQQTPPWSLNLGVTLHTDFSERVLGTLRADVSYRDHMLAGPPLRNPATNAIIFSDSIPDVILVGARYTLHDSKSGIDVYVYGRNLTNQLYDSRAFNIGGLGLGIGIEAEPRVIGAGIKIPFGGGVR